MTKPQTALITGASRGLGLELARAFAADGWRLVIDARTASDLELAHTELAASTEVVAIAGDVCDPDHRAALAAAAGDDVTLLVNNASTLGATPLPALADYPLAALSAAFDVNAIAPLALIQATRLHPGATILNITSDAAVEAYEGWGGYGASKAALEQLSAVLAAERPDLRVYVVDPGDMNTRMHQDAFPGEDISDRPPPSDSVPGLLALVAGDRPSGRYRAAELAAAVTA